MQGAGGGDDGDKPLFKATPVDKFTVTRQKANKRPRHLASRTDLAAIEEAKDFVELMKTRSGRVARGKSMYAASRIRNIETRAEAARRKRSAGTATRRAMLGNYFF